jgi:DNA invertase Pin-like site-specific DNA recombinase
MASTITRVFAYLRVSTAQQLDGGGHARQLDTIKKFCEQKGWPITRVVEDQQSGADPVGDRTKLVDMIETAPIVGAVIVVERIDRVARELMHQEIFLAKCKDLKVLVYAADTGEELVMAEADPSRIMIRQIFGAMAQWEKSMLTKKLLAGRMRKKLVTGKPCGGPPPFEDKTVIDDIMQLRSEGKTYRTIATILTEGGVRPPEYGQSWAPSTIHKIVKRKKEEAL